MDNLNTNYKESCLSLIHVSDASLVGTSCGAPRFGVGSWNELFIVDSCEQCMVIY